MKYGKLLLLFIFLLTVTELRTSDTTIELDHTVITNHIAKQKLELQLSENLKFKTALGIRESNLSPTVVNGIGAMGVWQFMPKTLEHLGYRGITPSRFRANPSIFPLEKQEEALSRKIASDISQLEKQWFRDSVTNINYIEKFVGTEIKGVKVTLAGLMGACHIGGVGGTMSFLDNQGLYNPKDCYGTSILDYLREFSEYTFHNENRIKERLQCLRKFEEDLTTSPTYSRWLKLSKSSEQVNLSVMATATTSSYQRHSLQHMLERELLSLKSYHSGSKCSYLSTTEPFYYSGAVQHLSITTSLEMGLARLNGTTLKSGEVSYMFTDAHYRLKKEKDYFNSTSNLYGMRHGMLNYLTYSQTSSLRRLKSSIRRGVDLDLVVDRRKKFITFKIKSKDGTINYRSNCRQASRINVKFGQGRY